MGEKSVDEKYMGEKSKGKRYIGDESLGEKTAGEKYMVEQIRKPAARLGEQSELRGSGGRAGKTGPKSQD